MTYTIIVVDLVSYTCLCLVKSLLAYLCIHSEQSFENTKYLLVYFYILIYPVLIWKSFQGLKCISNAVSSMI